MLVEWVADATVEAVRRVRRDARDVLFIFLKTLFGWVNFAFE